MAALAIDAHLLSGLASEIRLGTVIVTGTNGKGTTCRMLAGVMRASGLLPITNQEGANQPRGLATTLLAHASRGHLPADDRAVGLFEVDEGSLPEVVAYVSPTTLVFTNVFRDQMDRYLDLDYLTRRSEHCLRRRARGHHAGAQRGRSPPRLPRADLPNPRIFYGLDDTEHRRGLVDHTSDFPRCPRCTGELSYSCVFYAQLGHWSCAHCGLTRPSPQVRAAKVDLIGPASSRLQVTPAREAVLEIPLPGLYNAYNAVAAVAAATAGQLPGGALPAVSQMTPGFFRMEQVTIGGREVHLALAKNPNGYTEVLRALLRDGRPQHMLLALNDRDEEPNVSWIWDVDFESLCGLVPSAVLSGNRACDLAVRLKYAGWTDADAAVITVEPDPVGGLRLALAHVPEGQPLWVVGTYQVLWQLRDRMRRQGLVSALWEV